MTILIHFDILSFLLYFFDFIESLENQNCLVQNDKKENIQFLINKARV